MTRLAMLVRQGWRRLISMRTALVLLFLLALAAVPGSLLPQRPLNPAKVQSYLAGHGAWGRLLNAVGGFDVFGSVWFAAIYLLLFVSLIGCLVPRIRVYAKALRAKPLKAPRHLGRLAESDQLSTGLTAAEAAAVVRGQLRPRWRVAVRTEDPTDRQPSRPPASTADSARPAAAVTVSAEKGYSREAGNLVFHVALLVALVLIAIGRLYSYEGSTVVTEGTGFCNPGPYDSYRSGRWVSVADTKKFCIDQLNKFTVTYRDDGSPAQFVADVTYSEGADGAPRQARIRVNHPLRIEGDRVYLLNHGFSPTVTITRPGKTPVTDTEVFLPQDGFLTSEGVFKLSGPDGANQDIGLDGLFAPSAEDTGGGVIVSNSPQPTKPVLALLAYRGDLGLNGQAQSVYVLDKTKMTKVAARNLSIGQSMTLPDGTTVRFDGYKQWATLQVSHDPTQGYLLIAAVLMVGGLLTSLVVRRRRVWLRFTPAADPDRSDGSERGAGPQQPPRTLIEVGGLARNDSGNFHAEFESLVTSLRTALNATPTATEKPSAPVGAGAGKD